MDLVFPLPLSCWRRGSTGREKGLCSLCLIPGTGSRLARARPGLGSVPMCSFSPPVPESFCATLGSGDGWEGKGLFSPVCPEMPSALGCAWHEQGVALGVPAVADSSWASCACLGPCSAQSSLPAAPGGNKSHGKLPAKEQEDSGEGWGEPESAATQRGGIESGDGDCRKLSKASCASSCARFGANSPGNRPGKFAHPRPAQRELHQQLVPGEGAGGAAGEAHTLLGVPGAGGAPTCAGGDFCSKPPLSSATTGTRQTPDGGRLTSGTVTTGLCPGASFKAKPDASL